MKKLFSTLAFLAITTFSVFAGNQEPVKATVNDQMQITLPADQPLAAEYVIDITGKFSSEAALTSFCENFRDMGLSMRGDYKSGHLFITPTPLTDSTGKTWDAARWNEYFAGRAPKMQMFVQSMN